MNVECQNCGTEYSLDETLVASVGTSVRCSKCGDVFKVFPSGESSGTDEWRVRQVNGHIVAFQRMGVLQQWISKEKLSPDDMLSRNDGPWKRIGDIPEMTAFFPRGPTDPSVSSGFPRTDPGEREPTFTGSPSGQSDMPSAPGAREHTRDIKLMNSDAPVAQTVLDQSAPSKRKSPTTLQPEPLTKEEMGQKPTQPMKIDPFDEPSETTRFDNTPTPAQFVMAATQATIPAAQAPTPEPDEKPKVPVDSHDPDLSQIPAVKDGKSWDEGSQIEVESPAWTEQSDRLRPYKDSITPLPQPERKTGRWIALVVVVTIIGVAAYLVKFERTRLGNIFDRMLTSSVDERYNKFFDRGMESFLLDSDTHYRQADREFQKVLALEENHAPTLTALAEMYAVWAQYARDARLDAKTDFSGTEMSPTNKREMERLNREFDEKLAEADRWATQAIEVDKESAGPNRAMADVLRLKGDLTQAKIYLEKARGAGGDQETEYVSVLLDQDLGNPATELEQKLGKLIKEASLIRAMYRKARLTASRGEVTGAKTTLNRLFELNPDHLRARDLAARLDDKKTISITTVSNGDSSSDTADRAAPDAGAKPSGNKKEDPRPPPKKKEDADDEPVALAQRSSTPEEPSSSGGGSVSAMTAQASKLQENGRTGEALKLFEKVLEQSPNNVEALSGIAYCYLDKGSAGRAIANFRRALRVRPNSGPALLGLAETFKSQGENKQALKYYKQYLQVQPNGAQSGLARRNVKHLESSVESIDVLEEQANSADMDTPESEPSTPETQPGSGDGEAETPDDKENDRPDQENPATPPVEDSEPESPSIEPSSSPNPENQPPQNEE